MKIMSFNIHHGRGLDEILSLKRIAEIIRETDATVVGLQEVDRHFGERSEFQDQAKELAELLNFHYAYGPNINMQTTSGEAKQYGNAILSLYPIIESENFPLTSYEEEPRGCLKATIDLNGVHVNVFNTHLSLEPISRMKQIDELIEVTSREKYPSVLMGDFNAEPESEEIKKLLKDTNFTDCFSNIGRNESYPADGPNIRIDYIFTSTELDSFNEKVVNRKGSDHLPIVAMVAIK
ncbi:endonuclease/exonuclease/phosphatase family protein [Lederbergia wuyishanensis]|uniref:Endonuclease/exonuclease/phosphatase family metal-dependent hydrolase n=1 Tax=Lederbergia wuyishanensis TaxID=1347903 RepID=A0ABU0DA11_9BACI|nr:endonuclease/exonuclease/phosphatase family protein [Lederbergia wuyishanensis]MCJ8008503.1 endonuclease/exonuclease/phosphatase family protein [Lederbergia wuyishanensis]MDQ0345246.1 endonuclease/exonuclease/phosphatase family metal-dependent hydrolase [Lederbergia wuyishanensis]